MKSAEISPDFMEGLYADEKQIVERAVAKRQNEFAAGRVLARRLLRELGFPDSPLLTRKDRMPIWPVGAAGSISHTDGLCAVVVSRGGSVGLDVEQAGPLKRDLWRRIVSADEQRWIESRTTDEDERCVWAKLVFSAKECLYKCQYPITETFLDFLDVEVTFEPREEKSGTFRARILHDCGSRIEGGRPVEGFYFFAERWVISGMILRASSSP
jgi:4'-phosphopantetheinyl transferase EntD